MTGDAAAGGKIDWTTGQLQRNDLSSQQLAAVGSAALLMT